MNDKGCESDKNNLNQDIAENGNSFVKGFEENVNSNKRKYQECSENDSINDVDQVCSEHNNEEINNERNDANYQADENDMNEDNDESDGGIEEMNKRKEQKEKRMYGKAYRGVKKDPESKKYKLLMKRSMRKIKPTCHSNYCLKSKTRHCSEFTEAVCLNIFNNFWGMSWDMKKIYVSSVIDIKARKEIKCLNETLALRWSN